MDNSVKQSSSYNDLNNSDFDKIYFEKVAQIQTLVQKNESSIISEEESLGGNSLHFEYEESFWKSIHIKIQLKEIDTRKWIDIMVEKISWIWDTQNTTESRTYYINLSQENDFNMMGSDGRTLHRNSLDRDADTLKILDNIIEHLSKACEVTKSGLEAVKNNNRIKFILLAQQEWINNWEEVSYILNDLITQKSGSIKWLYYTDLITEKWTIELRIDSPHKDDSVIKYIIIDEKGKEHSIMHMNDKYFRHNSKKCVAKRGIIWHNIAEYFLFFMYDK